MSTALRCALAALLLLTGCSSDGDGAAPRSVDTAPSRTPAAPSSSTSLPPPPEPTAEPASQPVIEPTPAPQPSAAGTECEPDAAAQRTCRFVQAVLTGAVTTLTPAEQEVAARADDLPPAPWTLSGCDLVRDVTVECQVVFAPPREQELVATFVLQPVEGGYTVTDYLGLL